MTDLYSQYASGMQFTAGTIVGSTLGTSGMNPIVDRLNKVTGSELYWSCPGTNFVPSVPSATYFSYDSQTGKATAKSGGEVGVAPVFLPQNAVIKTVVCYGSAGTTDETWTFSRATISGNSETVIASAAFNTEDTTMGTGSVVDNDAYTYFLSTTNLTANDDIYSARIGYIIE